MNNIDINTIFERNEVKNQIMNVLREFENNYNNINHKRGIYLYGSPGSGKTHFMNQLLSELGYDVIKYDAGDIRNKNLIDTITSNNMSNMNVLDLMTKKKKKIAILMDEIDGMNSGDKGGLTALIKLIRQKKTKKQKTESHSINPIICIGNYYTDKKMRELMKVCNIFELTTPKKEHVRQVIGQIVINKHALKEEEYEVLLEYIQGDMCKLKFATELLSKNMNSYEILNLFQTKSFNKDAKIITNNLLENYSPIEKHNTMMNETDRTIIALLWHENVIDKLCQMPAEITYPLYYNILRNICFADYIDRITFQNQIWQFNEMSSLIKTFYNNKIFHDHTKNYELKPLNEVRFTKVLTKYSTEYNNSLFIQDLSQKLIMDKRDMISLFQEIRLCIGEMNFHNNDVLIQIEKIFEDYEINKLDIRRFYRYLDKNTKKESLEELEDDM
jgi:DNA polymerase III delta prime subunit